MLTYWMMYLIPAILALTIPIHTQKNLFLWLIFFVSLALLIGWRDEVGGDWFNYLMQFEHTSYLTYSEVLEGEDPGYYLINLWMYDLGHEIYAVNLISAVIFVAGLIRFTRKQYNPLLTMAVAVPYLIVVVAMGYTRQGIAIGLVMWAIVALEEKKLIPFLILTALAAAFHKSAIVMIGVGMFGQGTNRLLRIVAITFVGIGTYSAFLEEHQEKLWVNYVEAQMESQGAKIRVFMNLVPALLLFALKDKWKKYYKDYEFWRVIAVGAIASVFIVGLASTAIDRMALYMIPLQLVVFGRLPLFLQHKMSPLVVTIAVLLYYASVLFVWLNFATNASYWIPYGNYLWNDF